MREVLLAETAVMIAEGGADSVTMRGLAQRVGVSRSAPYRHFPDKMSLLTAVAEDGFVRLQQQMSAAVQGEHLLQDFYQMGAAYIHFALQNPTQYRLMFGAEGIQRTDNAALTAVADESFAVLQTI
ncbi:MAG: TetR/AcrR family transcriptional regulator, partial [Anaerolineae bacterium]|nr:TetR/AcrR family transcriptional regulator [Anaerolineae bacterium]